MADDDTTPGSGSSPEDDFQELIRQLFGGGAGDFDPEQLSRLSGMNIDPAMMQAVMRQLQGAFAPGGPDSPEVCFLAVTPERALALKAFGMGGRETWPA